MGMLGFLYGLFSYGAFLLTCVYAVGFVANLWVPKAIDTAPAAPTSAAVLLNLALLGLFALQHSVMARPAFKAWWTRLVAPPLERSTYVLLSSLLLALLFWQWRPIAGLVWQFDSVAAQALCWALYALGWIIVAGSTFMINHFDMFGLRQVTLRLKSAPYTPLPFVEVALYRFIRHPIMLGFLIAFWATPRMSLGHLLFALATTAYIFIGIWLEERDLRRAHGAAYERYRRRAGMILPRLRRQAAAAEGDAIDPARQHGAPAGERR